MNPVTFTVFPSSGQMSSSYYEDDGRSFAYEHGEYLRRTLTLIPSTSSTVLTFSKCEGSFKPNARSLVVRFVDVAATPKSMNVDGKKVQQKKMVDPADMTDGWSYDPMTRVAVLTLVDHTGEIRIVMEK
jgi:hypothetical protein